VKRIVYLLVLLLSIVLLNNCSKGDNSYKEDVPEFFYEYSDQVVKHVIHLTGSWITEYLTYINDDFTQSTVFHDNDTIFESITKNPLNEITYKRTFHKGENGYASYCIDTGFYSNYYYIARLDYEYENGFVTSIEIDWQRTGTNPDSGSILITRTITDENISSSKISEAGWLAGCTDYYSYNQTLNKVDIRNFSNGITGKWSKNLVSRITWRAGCPTGPSMTEAYSKYEYELDQNGYVTKMTETYTPSYHTSLSEGVSRTVYTTLYEYMILE